MTKVATETEPTQWFARSSREPAASAAVARLGESNRAMRVVVSEAGLSMVISWTANKDPLPAVELEPGA
jgi:hypothetical protein